MVESHTFLLHLFVILLSGKLLGNIISLFGAPSVIGELLAGIIIGPSLFGWIETNSVIFILAEIGVILLLFEVGLGTEIDKLLEVGNKAIVVAIGGFIAPLVFGYVVSYYIFDLSIITSLFIGGTLTATSIGITIRTLVDVDRENSPEGQITLGAAVLDDIFGVVLLALLYEFSISGEVNWINTFRVLMFVGVFFIVAPILAKFISIFIEYLDKRIVDPGLTPVTIISLVLFFAWLAHLFGAPELLGGFAAGLALSRRFFLPFGIAIKSHKEFYKKTKEQMRPIIQIFTPIFFVNVGLSLDLSQVNWNFWFFWIFSLLLLVVAICSKFVGAIFIHEPLPRRFVIGMAMVPRGEVGLIFAGLGSAAAVFNNDIYTGLIMVIVYTTLLSPFWIKLYYRMFGHLPSLKEGNN